MKRFISMLMILTIVVTSNGFFTACSAKESQSITWREWLSMINTSFGMESYIEEKPYISSITKEHPSFGDVQIAVEWSIIDAKEEFDLNANVTLKDVLVTLVNAGAFLQVDSMDEEKIEYAIQNFDDTIREYLLDKDVDYTTAMTLLAKAQSKWANLTFDNPIEHVVYKEDVIDCSKGGSNVKDYIIDVNGDVLIPKSSSIDIKEGDVFTLPINQNNFETRTFRAKTISIEAEYIRICVDTDIDLNDVVEELYIAETLVPTSENTVIRDGNGNIIYVGTEVAKSNADNFRNASYIQEDLQQVVNVSKKSITTTFEIDDWEIALKYKLDGALDMQATIKTPNILKNVSKNTTQELKGEISTSLSNLVATPVVDFSWGKLNEASLRLNYKTESKLGLKYSNKKEMVRAPEYSNGNGKYLTNLKKSIWKDKNKDKGAKTIKILQLDIYNAGVGEWSAARLCLDVGVTITAEGTATLTVTESGTKGLEYKAGKLRTISDSKRDSDFDLNAKAELTLGIGPALYAAGLKKSLISAAVEVGVGATVGVKMHLVDEERHLIESIDASNLQIEDDSVTQINITATSEDISVIAESRGGVYKYDTNNVVNLHLDICTDASIYFILKLGLVDSWCEDLLADKMTISWEFFGEDNGKFAHVHRDNKGAWMFSSGAAANDDLCTFEFKNFDEEESTEEEITETEETKAIMSEEESTSSENDEYGNVLTLSEMMITLNIGDTYNILIEQYPTGYTNKDIVIESENSNIVSVNQNGVILAKESGSAILVVSTKDGKYKAYCAITVLMEAEEIL